MTDTLSRKRFDEAAGRLRSYLREQGLRATRQREVILETFLDHGTHTSVEELYQRVRARDPSVGHATVYGTMNLLVAAGLASERRFHEGLARYEPDLGVDHHDHLVCTSCGSIEEFEDPTIERLQQQAAARREFQVHYHRLELYGLCHRCRSEAVIGDR